MNPHPQSAQAPPTHDALGDGDVDGHGRGGHDGHGGGDANASLALDALGDPNRRAILQILSSGGRSVREIADQLPISRPAVSRHLRLLKSAGLVADRADGTRNIYELRGEGVEAVRAYFASVWDNAAVRFRLVAENTRDD